MKINKLIFPLFTLMCTVATATVFGQDSREARIHEFIKALANENYPIEKIMEQNLCFKKEGNSPNDLATEKLIHQQLQSLRNNVKELDHDKLLIVKYKDSPKTEQNILMHKGEENDAYLITWNKENYMPLLFASDKIASIGTMNKGDHRVFLMFCK